MSEPRKNSALPRGEENPNEIYGRIAFGVAVGTVAVMGLGCLIGMAGLPNPCCLAGCLGAPAAFVFAGLGFKTESRDEAMIGIVVGALTLIVSLLGLLLMGGMIFGMVSPDLFSDLS